MRRTGRWAVAVVLLLSVSALSGCLGPEGGGDPPPGEGGEVPSTDLARIEAPNWSIGDHWTYDVGGAAPPAGTGEETWVVTGETDDAWIVDTTDPEAAFLDARTDVSFFGERGKTDLAGSQAGERVEYFRWPLEEGANWTTTWDGIERTVTVERVEDGTADLVATQDGRRAVEYTYDASVGHFSRFAFLDENTTRVIDVELTGSGSDFQGTAVRWSLGTGADLEGTFGVQPASEDLGFQVPEDATDLWLSLSVDCPSGAYDFGFGPSGEGQTGEDSSYTNEGQCPAEVDVTGPVVEDPTPGDYQGTFTATSPEAEGSYEVLLYVRTLQEIEVGEG